MVAEWKKTSFPTWHLLMPSWESPSLSSSTLRLFQLIHLTATFQGQFHCHELTRKMWWVLLMGRKEGNILGNGNSTSKGTVVTLSLACQKSHGSGTRKTLAGEKQRRPISSFSPKQTSSFLVIGAWMGDFSGLSHNPDLYVMVLLLCPGSSVPETPPRIVLITSHRLCSVS